MQSAHELASRSRERRVLTSRMDVTTQFDVRLAGSIDEAALNANARQRISAGARHRRHDRGKRRASTFVVASWWRAHPLRSTLVGRTTSVLLNYSEATEISATAKLSTPGKSSASHSTMTRFN